LNGCKVSKNYLIVFWISIGNGNLKPQISIGNGNPKLQISIGNGCLRIIPKVLKTNKIL
jgi:hypothetical protein